MLREAEEGCETEKELRYLKRMLEDYRTLLYSDCKQDQKKLGTILELLQWKASNGLSDKGFEELLKLIKTYSLRVTPCRRQHTRQKKVVCPLGLEAQKIHACHNDCILYRGEYENLDSCPVCNACRYKIPQDDQATLRGCVSRRGCLPRWCGIFL